MRLPLRTKLLAGFGAVVLLTLLLGLASLAKMNQINASTQYLADNTVPSVQLIGEVNTTTSDYRISQLQHVIATDRTQIAAAEQALAEQDAAIEKNLARYRSMTSDREDRRLYESVLSGWEKYKQQSAPFLAFSRRLDTEQAMSVLNDDARDTFSTFSDTAVQWAAYNQKLSKQFQAKAQAGYESARKLIIGLLLATIALALAIGDLLSRQVSRGVQTALGRLESLVQHDVCDLERGMNAMAEGDLTVDVKTTTPAIDSYSADKIGDVAKAVNAMREKVGSSVAPTAR